MEIAHLMIQSEEDDVLQNSDDVKVLDAVHEKLELCCRVVEKCSGR